MVVEEWKALPTTPSGKRQGTMALAARHGVNPKIIRGWVISLSNVVTKYPKDSTTSFYQGGAPVRPKKEQYQIVLDKIEKKLKEVQSLKEQAIQLINDM